MFYSLLLPMALAVSVVTAQTTTDTNSVIGELITAPNHKGRVADLPQDSDFVFDFANPPTAAITKGAGGRLVLASVATFPALLGNGIAIASGFLGPCGMNTPHTHPRATEFLYAVNGTLTNGMITETGSRFIINNVTTDQAMLLPQGSIHFQFNDNCEPVHFVSALNNVDPGVLLAAQGLFGLPPAIVAATLGQLGVEEVAGIATIIPDDIAFGSQECLARCGINPGQQPTNEQVPRVSGNALPADIMTASAWSPSNQSRSVLGAVADSSSGSSTSPQRCNPLNCAHRANRSYSRPVMKGRALVPTLDAEVHDDKPYDPADSQQSFYSHIHA
ncbi:RmlC-like cupin domain-containing protein [Fomitopsis serialis]|uniref:RmlC-like cupin domain-containing protein n=1 Tax=Fomitopsis serialis TaxID=139415 RepID=UPI0020084EED|nr:RmlC-like cupin domain-containing protein [Neoantrodia serialis]KAH9938174.1 RmlC-like cupin domain-containing protein [Neoantrodia serialis]